MGGEVACGGDGEYGGRVHADMLPLYIFDFLDDDQKRRFPTPKFGFRHPTDHFRSFRCHVRGVALCYVDFRVACTCHWFFKHKPFASLQFFVYLLEHCGTLPRHMFSFC